MRRRRPVAKSVTCRVSALPPFRSPSVTSKRYEAPDPPGIVHLALLSRAFAPERTAHDTGSEFNDPRRASARGVPNGKLELPVIARPGALQAGIAAVPGDGRIVGAAGLGERRQINRVSGGEIGVAHPDGDGAARRSRGRYAFGRQFRGHGRHGVLHRQRQDSGTWCAGNPGRGDAAGRQPLSRPAGTPSRSAGQSASATSRRRPALRRRR